MSATALAATGGPQSLIARIADRYAVEPSRLLGTLKATAFRQTGNNAVEATNEQMMALLVVADQYGLNPFTRELYAFPDKQRGIVPIVSVDGWIRIINSHPNYDGITFRESEDLVIMDDDTRPCPAWMEVTIYRRDRQHPTILREYLDECYRPAFVGKSKGDGGGTYKIAGPWQTHPKRFLRHKTLIQGGRVAFGFAGIYDPDEGDRIIEGQLARDVETRPKLRTPVRLSAPAAKEASAEEQSDEIVAEEPALTPSSVELVEAAIAAAKTTDLLDEVLDLLRDADIPRSDKTRLEKLGAARRKAIGGA